MLAACATGEDPADEADGAQPPLETGQEQLPPEEPVEAPDREAIPGGPPDLEVPVTLTAVAELGAAIAGAVGPDGTLYLADRSGTVHALEPDGVGAPVVDLSDETTVDSERGLLGLAFAADGSELFVSYTDLAGDSVIEAFAVDDAGIDAERRRTVLTLDQPFGNHNGGDIRVGPDGMLYIGFGDGGGGGDPLDAGQDLTTWLGAMLRIDPSVDPYQVPGDNPFVGNDDVRDEIFAFGLRNPWRFSFDAETGALWIADVGQNSREEINVLDPVADTGANLGWNLMEGTLPFAGDEPEDHHRPVHEYDTTSARCAVTGGEVYRGEAIPELVGAYLYSDYCEGRVRALVVDDGHVVDEGDLGVDAGRVVSFAADARGEVYVLTLEGQVWRLDPA